MIRSDLKSWILDTAQQLGFELCGFAPPQLDGGSRQRYLDWLARGYQGEMAYLEKPERTDLSAILPTVRSVICAGMVYHTAHPRSIDCDPSRGWISRYAWGQDYHSIMQQRLEQLLARLRAEIGEPFDAKVYVDTGPLLERPLAHAAGLGWLAKNTCLINEHVGSWFFLGEILTSLELEPDSPAWDRCGSCTRCLEACPTGALVEPYVLDSNRCIAYHTIELKGAIPEEFRHGIGRNIFGCDICQDVCPWNRDASATLLPQFEPRSLSEQAAQEAGTDTDPEEQRAAVCEEDASAFQPPLDFLASLSEPQFFRLFKNGPVRRARYRGFLRNVAVAMGNSRDPKFRPLLEKLAQHDERLVREHACWALEQLP